VSINTIPRAEFDRFKPLRHPEAESVFEETEWFADEQGVVLGVLARDRADGDWAYAVLGRDERGVFRAFENEVSIMRRDDARHQLIGTMERAVSTGAKMFPQGD
jgi:hypothetical protein